MLFCLFHAVFIIIVQEPNTFIKGQEDSDRVNSFGSYQIKLNNLN